MYRNRNRNMLVLLGRTQNKLVLATVFFLNLQLVSLGQTPAQPLRFSDVSLIFGRQPTISHSRVHSSNQLNGSEIVGAIVSGPNIEKRLQESKNKIHTVVLGKTTPLENKVSWLDKSRKYLIVQAKLKIEGERVPSIKVRITEGPLAGVVVRLRGMEAWDHEKEPLQSIYALPADLGLRPQKLDLEVVSLIVK